MNVAFLLIGSNAGDRYQFLQQAIGQLADDCGVINQQSGIYETAAWGLHAQPDFLNTVICLHTSLAPLQLLHAIQHIEQNMGRQREIKWGQRTLDIDILLYNNDIIDIPNLRIPHPYLHLRRFTMVPLAEIAAQLVHPLLHKTIAQLLHDCPDTLPVKIYNPS